MGLTRTFRFRRYDLHPDPTASPLWGAVCVTHSDPPDEDAPERGALSGDWDAEARADQWIAEHMRDTGHANYQYIQRSYVNAVPGEWL